MQITTVRHPVIARHELHLLIEPALRLDRVTAGDPDVPAGQGQLANDRGAHHPGATQHQDALASALAANASAQGAHICDPPVFFPFFAGGHIRLAIASESRPTPFRTGPTRTG